MAYSRSPLYQCTHITLGPNDTTKPIGLTHHYHTSLRIPINCQCGPIRLRPALTIRFLGISPNRPTPLCCLCGLVFVNLRPYQSFPSRYGKPPLTPWIFPSLHRVLALIPITLLDDLHAHYVSIFLRAAFSTDFLLPSLSYIPRGPFLAIVYSSHVAFASRLTAFG